MTRLSSCLLALALAAPPALAGAAADPALAGQSVTRDIDGGQQTREYARNGTLIYEVTEKQVRRNGAALVHATEREWQDNGTPLREQEFLGGQEIRATLWYMNGKIKEKRIDQSLHAPDGLPGSYVERYSDTGVLQSAGVFQGPLRHVGVHRYYDETGKLAREITYGPDGVQRASKTYNGGATATVEYYPDGSRKQP
ncbi:toxin-antitoxin system YwqK family antitoxin [Bordetella hinzii]|uniref:MORN repeat variant n=2 Tax=Bordetella hinzii TaxID=103855 RepID=A0AAN1RZF5_9BORD|nr:hypothetical protein [Bordetella hinzii]AKQ55859.1 MORN repeat variant [Bordetella hinzii]AKQ60391.1 MORN repeat variant [Bordetella hinzii]AZW18555.1 hypothetical protein CS347_18175 [Bordetella hinzii]KCB25572.1 MORN repeat protein [Bordetella hinzii OH87 BAL007II]KCB33520.1 MORN repeat protein [Bordetella hinzii L60]